MPLRARLPVAVAILSALIAPGIAHAAIDAHGSSKQVYATGLKSKAKVSLFDGKGREVATKRADGLGGVLFRNVKPGVGYRIRPAGGSKSGPLTVISNRAAPPSTDVYNQTLPTSGYGYMTMRDGTKLAIDVHPPSDISNAAPVGIHLPKGLTAAPGSPSPTLIEYSGYGYANPAGPTNGIAILANLMGFTVVDVNMRGTGCSGGAFDFFEPLQNLDGYDVIETVARQPWVLNHKVGMMGISYGGISQLFTAQLQPPSLAAISPLSVIDQTQTTLYPGGVLNTGFAVAWAKERQTEAKPAGPHGGQAWAYKQIQDGDQICKANQALHGQAANLMAKIRANDHYRPSVADPLSPITFVHKIKVPTFMACQWTDEQTGGHCPTLAEHMTGTQKKWFTYTNGTHVDSLDPATFNRWYDFLKIYIAREAPALNAAVYRGGCPVIYQEAMGVPGQSCPPDPIQNQPTLDAAQAAFEALPSIRILFDNGAGGNMPGAPQPGFEQSFAKFPIPGTTGRSLFFSKNGTLAGKAPSKAGTNSFTWNAKARPLADFSGDTAGGDNGLWTATPPYKWLQPPAGSAVSYVSSPLSANTTVIGAGAVHAWIRASKPTVDLQATITEVRPDGKETFVQGGWLRGNERKLDAKKSTSLEPVLSLRKGDRSPLSPKRYVKATIPLYYEGHVYRAGSRIRVYITAPNGDQPIWSFSEPKPSKGKATVGVAFSKSRPSRLVLPVVPGVDVPTGLPPCPGLRGEPCRDYTAYKNRK
jgi:predicted acyl esterase